MTKSKGIRVAQRRREDLLWAQIRLARVELYLADHSSLAYRLGALSWGSDYHEARFLVHDLLNRVLREASEMPANS